MKLTRIESLDDVRRMALAGRQTGNPELMYQALEHIADNAAYSDAVDVATMGLMAMDGVGRNGPVSDELATMSRRMAGSAALDTLTRKPSEYADLKGVAQVGERLTNGTNVCEPNLHGAQEVLEGVIATGIGGPVGLALHLALNIGEAIQNAGTTGTRHSALLYDRLHEVEGELVHGKQLLENVCDYDWLGVAGVYQAAFKTVGRAARVDEHPHQLAQMGSLMLRTAEENRRRYLEMGGEYAGVIGTAGIVAHHVLSALEETFPEMDPAWIQLARVGAAHDQEGDAVRQALDAIAEQREGDAVSLLAVARDMQASLPPESLEAFVMGALEVVYQRDMVSERPTLGPVMQQIGARVQAGELPVEKILDAAVEAHGDAWAAHGMQAPEPAAFSQEGEAVTVGSTRVEKK